MHLLIKFVGYLDTFYLYLQKVGLPLFTPFNAGSISIKKNLLKRDILQVSKDKRDRGFLEDDFIMANECSILNKNSLI